MMSVASITSLSQSNFRLTVTNIGELTRAISPIHVVQDIPWQINVFADNQKPNNNKALGISLVCATSDTTQSWTQTASFSCQLIPFDGIATSAGAKHVSEPQVFNCSMKSISLPSIVDWSDLLNMEKHLVKDDAIQLDINIDAVDPNDISQSMLLLENISKCCENDCLAEYQLTVVNIENLMAVRTPQFLLRGLLWDFSIYKDVTSQFAVQLALRTVSDKVSCKIQMTTKMTTTQKLPDGRVDTSVLKRSQTALVQKCMAWDKLMDARNGFVESNAVTVRIEIKIDKPEYVDENCAKIEMTQETTPAKQLKLECAVCLEAVRNQNLSCPPCGHVFCTECLTDAARKQKVCPTCNVGITARGLRRVFLPM